MKGAGAEGGAAEPRTMKGAGAEGGALRENIAIYITM
jgi:hypothetical protein